MQSPAEADAPLPAAALPAPSPAPRPAVQPVGTGGRFDEPMTPVQILFSFRGRVPRRTWWLYGVLAMLAASLYLVTVLRIGGLGAGRAESVVNLLLLWPILAVSAKRWHDRGKSTWWVLLPLIPVIGWLWAIVENGFLRGDPGPNEYGENLAGRL